MPTGIPRHPYSLSRPQVETQVATKVRILQRSLAAPAPTADMYDVIIRSGSSIAALSSLIGPEEPGVAEAFGWVARAASGLFRLPGPVDLAGPIAWQRGFQAAMIVRDRDALQVLAAAPLAAIRRSSTKVPEFGYLHIQALQAFIQRATDAPQQLLAALKAADPEGVDADLRDHILDITTPEIDLLYRVMAREQEPYSAALRKGVEAHKKYWIKGTRKRDELGQLAGGLLAAACAGHDAGLALEVDSDYIPRSLIER
jgi:hypothetical protein